MKATVVSYEVDANRKQMFQHKRKSAIENNSPKRKPRKYNNSHLDVGCTFKLQNGQEKPQCVVCSKVLASGSIIPNKL